MIGNFKIGKIIGEGSFSKVKILTQLGTNEKFALKTIDKVAREKMLKRKKSNKEERARAVVSKNKEFPSNDFKFIPLLPSSPDDSKESKDETVELPASPKRVIPLSDDNIVSKLELEVQLLMRLNHPNIIKTYQIFDSRTECHVIMEYAPGGELMEVVLKDRFIPEDDARKYFRQLVSAIDHFHLANIVHRDLKLENLMLDKEGNLKLIDFGMGRTFDSEDGAFMLTFCGTPNYAAFELISGIPYDGVKTDIWAMGVILYIMTCGAPPFKGATITNVYNNIKELQYRIPKFFSKELAELLRKIFVKDFTERIDMQGIRFDKWVNIGYEYPPKRYELNPLHKIDISAKVSGIKFDNNYTIITINNFIDEKRLLLGKTDSESFKKVKSPSALDIEPNLPPKLPKTVGLVHSADVDIAEWHNIHHPPKAIRIMATTFKKGITSSRDAVSLFQDLHRGLEELKIALPGTFTFKRNPDHYLFECDYAADPTQEVKFELEIMKVWGLPLHGLQTRKVAGNSITYQKLGERIIKSLYW